MINRYWRIFATGSAFFLFGFGGVILSLLVFPIVRLKYRGKEQQRREQKQQKELSRVENKIENLEKQELTKK